MNSIKRDTARTFEKGEKYFVTFVLKKIYNAHLLKTMVYRKGRHTFI